MMRNKGKKRGFTLMEILLVIGILALLAAFAVPNLMKAGDDAKKGIAESSIGSNSTIAMQLKKFRMDTGVFPDTDEGLRALFERPDSIDEDSDKWRGPYIDDNPEKVLKDPWGNEYQYRFPGEENDEDMFDLWSNGPDGEEGTDDDVVNWIQD